MKKMLLVGILLFSVQIVMAQINGVTESGDQVILYDDGTWKYLDEETVVDETEILVNEKKFLKSEDNTFLVKSKKLNIGIWINPKTWKFERDTEREDVEFQFQKKGEDLYGMLIAEKLEIPILTLKNLALENAKSAAPDIKIVKEEYRNVNGTQVLMMQMAGTLQGMKFTYYGYYHSNANGTIQLLAYTGANLFDEYKDEIESFLNGLVETEL